MPKATQKPKLVIITGLSGSGKSSVVKSLEDLSFYCIDNMPIDLIEPAVNYFLAHTADYSRFALGPELKTQKNVQDLVVLIDHLRKKIDIEVIFLAADEDVLERRYAITRRKHPLIDESGNLVAAIRREAHLLAPLRTLAQTVFDTSTWSPHYLVRTFEEHFSGVVKGRNLHVTITSFGFKYGVLRSIDSLYDVRFLKNPYFDPKLKDKTGLDTDVAQYVFSDPQSQVFLDKLVDLHKFLLPHYYREGKHYFRIGVGCTGGQHRSVLIAERLAATIDALEIPHVVLSVTHRDMTIGGEPRE